MEGEEERRIEEEIDWERNIGKEGTEEDRSEEESIV